MLTHHIYPTSLELPDLAHSAEETEGLIEAALQGSTLAEPEPACALCQAGLCVQRAEPVDGGRLIVHGMLLQ